jgi:hypothetical protein
MHIYADELFLYHQIKDFKEIFILLRRGEFNIAMILMQTRQTKPFAFTIDFSNGDVCTYQFTFKVLIGN